MKTFRVLYPSLFFTSLAYASLLLSPMAFAQTNCTTYLGGVTSCDGPGGYHLESRQGLNGQSSYYDNGGSSGTVTQTLNGGVNVSPAQVGRGGPSAIVPLVTRNGPESITPAKSDYYHKYQSFP